jgi:glutamine synthetase
MAALDGIKNKIDPTAEGFGPYDVNIFDLPDEEKAKIKGLPKSLDEATDALIADHDFLLEGGVFTEQLLQNIIKQNRRNSEEIAHMPHPKEFELYFDL